MAILVDRRHVSYKDLVSKYWPEFAKNGKEGVTIEMVMSHAVRLYQKDEITSLSFY